MLACYVLSCSAMPVVVAFDSPHGLDSVLQTGKGKQSPAGRNELREACVLNDRRLARREITNGTAAKPAGVGRRIEVLRHAEFPARALDVFAILLKGRRNGMGGDHGPAKLLPLVARRAVAAY